MRPASTAVLLLLLLGMCCAVFGQQTPWNVAGGDLQTQSRTADYDPPTGTATLTGDVIVTSSNTVLTADQAIVDKAKGEVIADGRVRIQSEDMVWAGEHIRYNFKTKTIQSDQFRAGKPPFFAGGEGLSGDVTNQVYTATNGYITLDDYSNPTLTVRAKRLVIRPGDRFIGHSATLRIAGVPVFYLPFFSQSLSATTPAFTVTPGYRSRFGPFLHGRYNWNWGETLDGKLRLDYRVKRGPGVGPDLNLHLGDWGEAMFKYYYLKDSNPETNQLGVPFPDNRQRVEFNWLASPFTNTTFKSRVSYQTDEGLRREFFEGDYRANVQPSTFVEARHFWDNYSLSVMAQPRVDNFFETVERLPEVKLTAFRQQLGATPLYYESETRAGYLRRLFAETNGPTGLDFEATRADSYHQIVLPTMLFGWLNFTPRAGARVSYYSEADGPGATTREVNRSVFNTGAELSFKLSRTWAGAQGGMFNLDGLRHIIEPSVNYVYVPQPDALPGELPQFDALLPSLNLLPIDYPDFNAIDSVDSQNVVRAGMRNRFQTKRDGQVQDLLDWNVFSDFRLRPDPGQKTFSDVASDLKFRPRRWLTLHSQTRYDPVGGQVRLAFNSLTLEPNTTWSWSLGYFYLRDDFSTAPTAWGGGNNQVMSTIYLRFNENWGLRASHYFDARAHELEEQTYTVYRDFRSWTGALSFRARENVGGKAEYTVAFLFSLKALPRFNVGEDSVRPDALFSY